MKILNITAQIVECSKLELEDEDLKLVLNAEDNLENSYSPYSKFAVSASVKLKDGTIINGTNQENAATPSGICAERTAIFYANSQFPENKVEKIAIAAKTNGSILKFPITPCGMCRQVILETEKRYSSPIKIILSSQDKCFIINSIKDILPLSFDESFFDN